jgi:hypothetical protein
MAHETTIGSDQRIYQVTLSTSRVLLSDLLDATQVSEIENHDVLDGYIFCQDSPIYISHKPTGAEEPISAAKYAYMPFLNWHKKIYIRADAGTPARIKMILGFIQRG